MSEAVLLLPIIAYCHEDSRDNFAKGICVLGNLELPLSECEYIVLAKKYGENK
jgi:hypothetical protein